MTFSCRDCPFRTAGKTFLEFVVEVDVDLDMDGHVDYEEFVKMMLSFPSKKTDWYWPVTSALKWLHQTVMAYKRKFIWIWVLFSITPAIMWIEKLISICSEFERQSGDIAQGLNELLRQMVGPRDTSDFSCEYRTFGFKLAALVKWVVVDVYEGV